MHFINAISTLIQCILIFVDVNAYHTILHHCCFTAPLFKWQNLVCSYFLYQRLGVIIC